MASNNRLTLGYFDHVASAVPKTYGTIRAHQEREFPARVYATALHNPEFAAYARAFGGHGERVESTEQFGPAYERAVASGRPAIIHCLIDPETITPTTTISKLRAAALKK